MDPLTLAPLERPSSACQGLDVDPSWWDGDDPEDVAKAVAVCRRCPEAQACLIWALKTRQQGPGVYGGHWFHPPTRRELARKAS